MLVTDPVYYDRDDSEHDVYDNVAEDTVTVGYAYPYPDVGYQVEHNRADRSSGQWGQADSYGVPVDWSVGGTTGATNTGQWSIGPVESNEVEDFTLYGARIRVRRNPEGAYGPVTGSDYLSDLAAAIASDSPPPTDERVAEVVLGMPYGIN